MELMKIPGSLTLLQEQCVCVCVFLYGAVSLLTVLKYIAAGFHFKIYLQTVVYIHYCASIENPQKHAHCIIFGFSQDSHLSSVVVHPVILQIHCMDFCQITCLSHVA